MSNFPLSCVEGALNWPRMKICLLTSCHFHVLNTSFSNNFYVLGIGYVPAAALKQNPGGTPSPCGDNRGTFGWVGGWGQS